MAPINWHLVVGGLNHKGSSLEEREPLQLQKDEMASANRLFGESPDVKESAILSTCNRIEFYFVAKKQCDPFELISCFYKNLKSIDITSLQDKFYIRKNKHAADHLFRVAAGIDSMVLGENQIMGQAKDAYSSACAVRTAGKVIHRLFHQAFRVGKLVRTDTEMGKGACSVSSAAVELIKDKINGVDNPVILFVGINQMVALAADGLNKFETGEFLFANRTEAKAKAFAEKYGGRGFGFDKLTGLISKADVMISCTGSRTPVISGDMIAGAVKSKAGGKLLIMDMAIPRDVDIEKNQMPDVSVFDLEDIKDFVRNQQAKREEAIPAAEEIINRKLGEFIYWFDHVRQEPIYNGLGDTFDEIFREELGALIEGLPPDTRDRFDRAGKKMINKLLLVKLKEDNSIKQRSD